MHYLFELGHSPGLSLREISSVLNNKHIKHKKKRLDAHFLIISTKQDIRANDLMDILGGTIRISVLTEQIPLRNLSENLSESISQIISYKLARQYNDQKLAFSISTVNTRFSQTSIAAQVKKYLKAKDINSRFIETSENLLPPIAFTKETKEYVLAYIEKHLLGIFETISVTNVRDWQYRDRQRPSVDAVSGVLPPKVARMLINIGNDTKKDSITFLDPFCGSGTILMEALLLGYDSVGFDISAKAVEDSTKNLNWLKQKYPITTPVSLYQADSSEVKPKDLGLKPVDLIVTEGYLGPSTFDQSQLSVIIKELKELYIKVLPNLSNWLVPGGTCVFALPDFVNAESDHMHTVLIDTCREAGYTFQVKPFGYSNVGARVKRKIYILKKN